MKKLGFLITILVITSLPAWSQGAKSIRITEVMTDNRTNLVDEYGQHKPWVELSNSSFTTYNVRGMFLTTDRRVLDKKISPEARRQLMCPLPNNEPRTTLGGKKASLSSTAVPGTWMAGTDNIGRQRILQTRDLFISILFYRKRCPTG